MINIYKSRSWVEIDLNALSHNIRVLSSLLKEGTSLMAVVKANGYGHGMVAVAKYCQKMKVKSFAVATIDEGIELRQAGIDGEILILGYSHPFRAEQLHEYQLIQCIVDYHHAWELNCAGHKINVNIKIDSGMHRLGFGERIEEIKELYKFKYLNIVGYFTHLCTCDSNRDSDINYTKMQINKFNHIIGILKKYHYNVGKIHLQSSYGLINYPEIKSDYVRCGIFMYGVKSSINDYLRKDIDLKPVLSVKARIAMINHLPKGSSLGYGLTYQVKRDSVITTVLIGYGDGLPRQLSSKGFVLVKDQRCPIVGSVCMDQILVDITNVKSISSDEIVTIIGKDDKNEIKVEEVALCAKTISNEILCQISNRLPRLYIGGN